MNAMLLSLMVVKMMSYPCDRPGVARFGSGVWIENAGKKYVLTSEHVVFHGRANEGICHKAYSEALHREIPLSMTMVNFAKGLALFEPAHDEAVAAIPFAEMRENVAAKADGFGELAGYPQASGAVLKDDSAQVLSADSDRTILPSVPAVIEVNGHNEYGMSGGAFFDGKGHYRGLLSHQYLQVVVGKPTRLYDTDEGTAAGQLVGLVIPLATIVPWLDHYFTGGKKEEVRFDLAAQLHRRQIISLDGVRFSPRSTQTRGAWKGGDPVGIGGDETDGGKPVEIVLSLEKIPTQGWPFAPAPWLHQTKEKLAAGGSAIVTGLLKNGKRYGVGNLTNFFAQMERGFTPLIRLTAPFTTSEEIVRKIVGIAGEAAPLLARAKARFADDLDARELLEAVALDLELVANRQFELVDLEELARLIASRAWTGMMIEDLDLASSLKSRLLQLQEQLKKIKVRGGNGVCTLKPAPTGIHPITDPALYFAEFREAASFLDAASGYVYAFDRTYLAGAAKLVKASGDADLAGVFVMNALANYLRGLGYTELQHRYLSIATENLLCLDDRFGIKDLQGFKNVPFFQQTALRLLALSLESGRALQSDAQKKHTAEIVRGLGDALAAGLTEQAIAGLASHLVEWKAYIADLAVSPFLRSRAASDLVLLDFLAGA